jgi:hypothetical protein
LVFFCLADAGCASRQFTWPSPPAGVIRDKAAAITIARAMWVSMNPSLQVTSEDNWQRHMVAHLDGNVWRVREPGLPPNSIGGRWEIDLDARDGRFLRAFGIQ